MTHDLLLSGCVSTALGTYLKALGIHRIVSEQFDPAATSYWDGGDAFHLVSSADRAALTDFFANRYAPTPLVTPWNGGSGFYPGDQQSGIQAITQSTDARFAEYRDVISRCRAMIQALGLTGKPNDKDVKLRLLREARSRLPDGVLGWLDAAYVVGEDARYPAIVGTGGNDGRLEFGNNFIQRVTELFLATPSRARSKTALMDASARFAAAVFGEVQRGTLHSAAVGQFSPALAGGTNMTTGLSTEGRVNPWDFVLTLEGTLAFAGAAVRRLDGGRHGSASFPFHVNPSPVGYGSSATEDGRQSRCELWMPLWSAPSTFREVTLVFGEARLEVGRRRARSGLDVARALATLGVDRGLDRFERFGILKRNGLSYLAARLGRFEARSVPSVDLLRELDDWIEPIGWLDGARPEVSAGLRRLEEAMFDACRSERRLAAVLAAVGNLERALASSEKSRRSIRPLRGLSSAWHPAADDGSSEFAIASAVASWDVREALEAVDRGRWTGRRSEWTDRSAMENIAAIARRRILTSETGTLDLEGRGTISTTALRMLLAGAIDQPRLRDLVFGLALLSDHVETPSLPLGEVADVDRVFCVLRAVTSPRFLMVDDRYPSPRTVVAILARLAARDINGALTVAERRLTASGWRLRAPVREVSSRRDVDALAAALVVPLPHRLEDRLIQQVVRPPSEMLVTMEVHR
jgi:CRISPR-associated protein Csx17